VLNGLDIREQQEKRKNSGSEVLNALDKRERKDKRKRRRKKEKKRKRQREKEQTRAVRCSMRSMEPLRKINFLIF